MLACNLLLFYFFVAQSVQLGKRLVHFVELRFERFYLFFVTEYVCGLRFFTAARNRAVRSEHLAVAGNNLKAVPRLSRYRNCGIHVFDHDGVAQQSREYVKIFRVEFHEVGGYAAHALFPEQILVFRLERARFHRRHGQERGSAAPRTFQKFNEIFGVFFVARNYILHRVAERGFYRGFVSLAHAQQRSHNALYLVRQVFALFRLGKQFFYAVRKPLVRLLHFGKHLVARFRHVVLRAYAVYLLRRLVYLRNAIVVYFVILVEFCRYRILFGYKAVYFGFESRALLGGKSELFAYSRNSFGKVFALSLQRLALRHESRHV